MKILFVTATRIGDAVLSTGLLHYLVGRYPDARFTIVAGPVAAPLFEAVPTLERIIPVTKRPYSLHWLELYRAIAPIRWDLVVDLRRSALSFILPAKRRRVIDRGDLGEHRVRQLGRLFDLDPPPAPYLWSTLQHEREAANLISDGSNVLALGPTANWGAKQWRASRFAELARRLSAPGAILSGARIVVMAAAHERPQSLPILNAFPPEQIIDLVGKIDLLTAAAALRRAALFVGNDNGLMHIAAAVGTPTLGLFGPSPPERYAPWGSHTAVAATAIPYRTLVTAPDYDYRKQETLMDSLSVDAVEEAARRLWRRIPGIAA
jgi:ADP-heptose:LPS heptosyltransferase